MIAPSDSATELAAALGLFGAGFSAGAVAGGWFDEQAVGALAGLVAAIRIWNEAKRD
jgi:hypothetical protein